MMTESQFLNGVIIMTPILVGAVGWSVRLVIAQIRALREDLKEYVRRETCRAHRDSIGREIMEIKSVIKFGRRSGDKVLSELIALYNKHMDKTESENLQQNNGQRETDKRNWQEDAYYQNGDCQKCDSGDENSTAS